ncbi:hypothetical protein OTK51_21030 [Vibrio scophthalmi]|uniref:SH3 domain-containing protein n=1 Tax=Vibrio scophthalmi TaxID=45658 RepID=UPI0022851FC3|nr:SH3 domain-containing protein [Vibrio scophthalmi]MCY9805912.1 hypothetical protein [Vibrio scophthalmi]
MTYMVIREYIDVPEHPIRIEKGEKLQFVEDSNSDGDWANWVFCKGVDKEGWIPKQILKISGNEVTVLQDYFAKEHCLAIGETLIEEYELNGWIWCKKVGVSDESAWAPLNHLSQK